MNKLHLFFLSCLLSITTFSQELKEQEPMQQCGTPVPSQQWDEWFNKEVEKFKESKRSGKSMMVNYTIPMIVHVIHWGEAVGTYPNLSVAQINSQLAILNADMAGTGNQYGNTVPPAFAGLIANTGIQFCFAVTNPTGGALAQPGIDRINGATMGWTNPATVNNITLVDLFNNVIKPATIWDPTKYFNVWVSAKSADPGILGFGLFPAGTGLTGIPGGTANIEGPTTSGVYCYAKCFGNTGTVYSPDYDKGRTMTHEVGHYLGLRHMWGDGNCLTDFCNDTPWAKTSNAACPTQPYHVNLCGAGLSPNGEMTMNFMDYVYQSCMYMFTPDQATRMQTAMSQGTYRNLLGTHGLCAPNVTPAPGPAVAEFSIMNQPCINGVFSPSNTSLGGPTPSYTWTCVPSASFNPNPFVASPAITFTAGGTYTLILTASNTVATSSATQIIYGVGVCPKPPVCLDTLRGITKKDTLTTYLAPTNSFVLGCQSGFTGFLSGTNCYKDKEFAQFFPAGSYSDTPLPQVNSAIVLFDKRGTKCTPTTSATQIYCKIYGGTGTQGPGATIGQRGDSLGAITRSVATISPTNQVQYCGDPTYIFPSNYVIPFVYNFAAPVIIPTSGFFVSVQTPYQSSVDSIKIFTDTKTTLNNDSTAWCLLYGSNNWRTLRYQRGAKVQLAIMPQITCRPVVGIPEISDFKANINIMPNPSNGLLSLVCTFKKQQKINVKVFNYIGQQLSSDDFGNVQSNVFDIDLSSKPDGVYFLEISDGNEKVTKKIIISK
jgi:hypothetical protein